jgi:hypothetical protein
MHTYTIADMQLFRTSREVTAGFIDMKPALLGHCKALDNTKTTSRITLRVDRAKYMHTCDVPYGSIQLPTL